MKMFWKTQDQAIDRLLGAERARLNEPARICREFDPDLANAYIEHSLPTTELARYEQHLSECAGCRKSIVALARMAEADPIFSRAEAKSLSLAGRPQTGIKRLLGAMTAPQWAMAAAVVLVAAISLPVLLSRKDSRTDQQAAPAIAEQAPSSAQAQVARNQESADAMSPAASPSAKAQQQPGANAQAKLEKDQESPEKDLLAQAKQPAAEPASAGLSAGAGAPAPSQTGSTESKADSPRADQSASKAVEQAQPSAPAPAPAPQQDETQLPKINPDEARRVPEDKNSAQVTPLKPSSVNGEDLKKKEATIRNEDNIAPPPKQSASNVSAGREITRGAAGPSKFRDSRGEVAQPPRSTKVGGKKFWLRDDIWTEKDYNPDKEMPIVTIIRDSDVYRELLAKHSGMRPFLTGFTENARVIFVYKGTAYKLIPQEGK